MDKTIIPYQKILEKHLFFEDGEKFQVIPGNKRIPIVKITDEDLNWVNPKLHSAFPLTTTKWLADLPDFIKIKLGTNQFQKELTYEEALDDDSGDDLLNELKHAGLI